MKRPLAEIKNLLELFVFVLHEDCATVDINDTDGVSSAGRDQACGLAGVGRIRLEHDLNTAFHFRFHN